MATRREALYQALLAALALSTPGSLAALMQRTGRDRYLVIELRDGRLLAVDLHDWRRAYLLELEALEDAELRMSESGSMIVRDGRIAALNGPARTRYYELVADRGRNLVISRRDRRDLPDVRIAMSPPRAGRLE